MVVLYENDEGLVRLQELLRLPQVIFIDIDLYSKKFAILSFSHKVKSFSV